MENPNQIGSFSNMGMANEEQYREKAESYRSSDEYRKMIGLYPILKESLGDCQQEELVA